MIYLDNAATSRHKPQRVLREMEKQLKNSANAGRAGHTPALSAGQKIEEARDYFKRLLHSDELVFTKNCTEALNLAIKGLDLSGHVITTVFEHNSVLRPLSGLAASGKIKLTVLAPDYANVISPRSVARAVTSDTVLAAVSHASNVTGTVQPIYEIADALAPKGVLFLVDAAQSVGHLKIDVREGIDMLAAAGHKGLHGAQGTGFLAFRRKLKLKPLLEGGTGISSSSLLQPADPPEGLESGTQNVPAIAGLLAGAVWTEKKFDLIHDRITLLAEQLIEGLRGINGVTLYTKETTTGVVSFNVKKIFSGEVADTLNNEYQIAVRAGLHCAPLAHKYLGTFPEGTVRASVGYNNSPSDVACLIAAVREISKRS